MTPNCQDEKLCSLASAIGLCSDHCRCICVGEVNFFILNLVYVLGYGFYFARKAFTYGHIQVHAHAVKRWLAVIPRLARGSLEHFSTCVSLWQMSENEVRDTKTASLPSRAHTKSTLHM